EVVGEIDGWYKLQLDDVNGPTYVSGSYITPEETQELTEPEYSHGVVQSSYLNVRSGPGTDHETIGGLEDYTRVELEGETSDGWYQISGEGFSEEAYVSGDYIVPVTIPEEDVGYVDANISLNVREGPSTSYDQVSSIPRGEQIDIVGEIDGWYKLQLEDVNGPTYVSGNLVTFESFTVGYVDANVSLRVREGPSTSYDQVSSIPRGERVYIVGEIDGWYKIQLEGVSGPTYVSGNLVELFETSDNEHVAYTSYDVVFEEALSTQMNGSPQISSALGGFQNASESEVAQYLNPSNNDRFQHLLLTESVGVSAGQLNNVLSGSGILDGMGQPFIDAGNEHSVNEIYLISHALLETGHGTSRLATGIEVGTNGNGNAQVVTSGNRSNLSNIRTTYNTFGIGAADANPETLGAIYAYNQGWFSPEAAIIGGAEFISQRYVHNDYNQNTLYKMRWNPANPGFPQYATDIGWAVKQVPRMESLYEQLNNPDLYFDIPEYQ
ncbi:SH3 domain-containing protein, partial [Natribacillus halophilus]